MDSLQDKQVLGSEVSVTSSEQEGPRWDSSLEKKGTVDKPPCGSGEPDVVLWPGDAAGGA